MVTIRRGHIRVSITQNLSSLRPFHCLFQLYYTLVPVLYLKALFLGTSSFPAIVGAFFDRRKYQFTNFYPLSLSLSVTRVSGFSEMSVFVQIWKLGLTFLDLRFSLNLRNLRYFCKKLLSRHPRVTRECQPDCHSALLDAFPVSCLKCHHPFLLANARFLFLRESGKLKLAAG